MELAVDFSESQKHVGLKADRRNTPCNDRTARVLLLPNGFLL